RAPIEKAPHTPSAGPSQHKPQPVQKSTWGSFFMGMGMGAQYRISQEVRKTVSGLIHDLVRNQTLSDTNAPCVGILDSCREVCTANSISLSSLLQEPYIEGHCALYWAIVNRPTDGSNPASLEIPPLVQALLVCSTPLAKSNIKDAPDTISQAVGIPARHDAPFSVEFEFAHFQKRMQVSQVATLAFVSHGKALFSLSFTSGVAVLINVYKITNGQWAVGLRILDQSPNATVTATYLLEQHASKDVATDESFEPYELTLKGDLDESHDLRSTFLTADGTLRGKLTVQIINK
ncbi:hypothetical protein C8J57DRAFT_1320231, partial [Mycena rebaudengoi]